MKKETSSFTKIPDSSVILTFRGVCYQKELFSRGIDIYAQWGNGYVRLLGQQYTSLTGMGFQDLSCPGTRYHWLPGMPPRLIEE